MKNDKEAAEEDVIPSAEGETPDEEENGCLVICPLCGHKFNCFANAESFSMIRCPACKKWFHVHIKMGEKPTEYLSPDDFVKETEEIDEGIEEEPEVPAEGEEDEESFAGIK